ncbi:alpha/beta fold hydrolase [Sulfobacillus thermosulfidooxidans]|uniref:alpha/beta fold hydrolase n=1 Tax=Sulfobacillus thermosulfidooxidans TaxID=28034 RepID=UPI0006B51842|nr:alpha/beta fold hydrolase [Sulfobacillus thermosulfidooxidans]
MTHAITMDAEFLSDGQTPLFIRQVSPEKWRAQLIFIHASLVHSEYYLPIAVKWAQAGIRVILPDLEGHGRSHGTRGHLRHFSQHINNIQRIYAHLHQQYSSPIFIGGESYGALMAYLACQQELEDVLGAILIAPAFGLQLTLPPWLYDVMTHIVHPLLPKLRPLRPLPVQGVSLHPDISRIIMEDRNVNRHYTLGFLVNLWKAQKEAKQKPLPHLPLLTLLSTHDAVTRNDDTEGLLKSHHNLELHYHNASGHSLIADQPDFVLQKSIAWIARQLRAESLRPRPMGTLS